MKFRTYIRFTLIILLFVAFVSSCKAKKRDCKGRKKTVKTQMGGWL